MYTNILILVPVLAEIFGPPDGRLVVVLSTQGSEMATLAARRMAKLIPMSQQ